jgi:hypothetical protein
VFGNFAVLRAEDVDVGALLARRRRRHLAQQPPNDRQAGFLMNVVARVPRRIACHCRAIEVPNLSRRMSAVEGLAWYAMEPMTVAQLRCYRSNAQLPCLLERSQAYEMREPERKGLISPRELPRALGIAAADRLVDARLCGREDAEPW